MNIPIIILNWNGWIDTHECLEALLQQSIQNFVVYLVDNGSEDGSQENLKKFYGKNPKIKLILNRENLGFTKGNNLILSTYILPNPTYQYAILLNNDAVPTSTWLENLIQSAKKNDAAMVSSKMVDYYEPDKMDNAGHMMLNTGEILPIGHGELISQYDRGFENMDPCAGAGLYTTKMLKDIGIFDEHFNTGYEDAELGIRAVVSGYKCWYEPKAVVYHKMGQSIKKIFNYDYSLMIQRHILYSYFKLTPTKGIILTIPSFIFKYATMFFINTLFWRKRFLKIMFESIGGTVKNFKRIQAARKAFYKDRQTIGTLGLFKKQTFFLIFDIKRFYKYFILRKRSALDVYGKIREVS